jgi:ABC-type cobalamin transport system permease subunit
MNALLLLLIAGSHALLWWLCVVLARRSKFAVSSAALNALGPALAFSPGYIGAHGVIPFPAIASLLLQPNEAPTFKVVLFLVTYFVLFQLLLVCFAISIRRKRKTKDQ